MLRERPYIEGRDRRVEAAKRRAGAAATDHAAAHGAAATVSNGDEARFGASFPACFTKGLEHDGFGVVRAGYAVFVEEINGPGDATTARDFANVPRRQPPVFSTTFSGGGKPAWRGWESPRTGHYYDLQGPDADAVGMAPAPALGSEELVGEMAEVYAMALLRDVPFRAIADETGSDAQTGVTVRQTLAALDQIGLFDQNSSAPRDAFAKRRLSARQLEPGDGYDLATGDPHTQPPSLTGDALFRGSGPGAKAGPHVSQFMMVGNAAGGAFGPLDGYIAYGSQVVDQRGRRFAAGLDYMINWHEWLDVQNGANLRGRHAFADERRFIATPRDVATYVRFDALYQAYLNACLLLLDSGAVFQPGFPDQGAGAARAAFAAFGGPHVLSLVTEVATRCLKAARRQKFNYHRRARPERIGGLLTIGQAVRSGALSTWPEALSHESCAAIRHMVEGIQPMAALIARHNAVREAHGATRRPFSGGTQAAWLAGDKQSSNLLLAMAFPEGSPMHPSYAAGHATVAGGCVTMLKAFFRTIDDNGAPLPWNASGLPAVEALADGSALEQIDAGEMTLEGELNKLAANISIARNMAGVHYYSDYYDSLRMGERIAVGMLLEQLAGYDERVALEFRSFDGDVLRIDSRYPSSVEVNGDRGAYVPWLHRPTTAPVAEPPLLIATAAE